MQVPPRDHDAEHIVATTVVPVYDYVHARDTFVYTNCIKLETKKRIPSLSQMRAFKSDLACMCPEHQALIVRRDGSFDVYCCDESVHSVKASALCTTPCYPRTTDYGVTVDHHTCMLFFNSDGDIVFSAPMFDHHTRFSFEFPARSIEQYVRGVAKMQLDSLQRICRHMTLLVVHRDTMLGKHNDK